MYVTFTMAKRSKAIYLAKIPPVISSHNVEIETDIVDINIPAAAALKVVFEEGQHEIKPPREHQTRV